MSPTWSKRTTTGLAVKHGTLLAGSEKRIQAFKTKSLRKVLLVSYLEHRDNNWSCCETWDSTCRLWKKDPVFQNKKPEESSPRLLLGAQEQQLVLL